MLTRGSTPVSSPSVPLLFSVCGVLLIYWRYHTGPLFSRVNFVQHRHLELALPFGCIRSCKMCSTAAFIVRMSILITCLHSCYCIAFCLFCMMLLCQNDIVGAGSCSLEPCRRPPRPGLTDTEPCRGLLTPEPCRGLLTPEPCRGLPTPEPGAQRAPTQRSYLRTGPHPIPVLMQSRPAPGQLAAALGPERGLAPRADHMTVIVPRRLSITYSCPRSDRPLLVLLQDFAPATRTRARTAPGASSGGAATLPSASK